MNEEKIVVSELKEGMYVSRLDRPWLETPFLIQGIRLYSDKDIRLLQEYCNHVYIDIEKTREHHLLAERRTGMERRKTKPVSETPALALPKRQVEYTDKSSVEEELEIARELSQQLTVAFREIMDDARHEKKINAGNVKNAVKKMKESILRNPSGFLLLRLLKDKDSYSYSHCLHVSALSVTFGRHLGLSSETLDDLAIGALLCDVGKARLSQELLNKPGGLTDKEYEEVKQHVVHSVAIMEEAGGFSLAAKEIVMTHHERFDGSGYLRGLEGARIPLLGRMAAIVDAYDAMTSEKIYSQAVSAYEALRRLYGARDTLFQDSLVEHFIQAIGIYPIGTIVELNTGEVGIVVSQNQLRRLRPKIMLVLDREKKFLEIFPFIDLFNETRDEDGHPLEIVKALEPGDYGIDPREFFL